MARSRRRHLMDRVNALEGEDRETAMTAMWIHSSTSLDMTPRTAEFFLSLLTHPDALDVVQRAIHRCGIDIIPDEEDEREGGDFFDALVEEVGADPDPVGVLRSVKTMTTLTLSKPHATALGLAVVGALTEIAKVEKGCTTEELKQYKLFHPNEGLLYEKAMAFHGDDPEFLRADTFYVMGQLMAITTAFAEFDVSVAHAVSVATRSSHGGCWTLLKYGRNDPCPCESGRKYKKCCKRRREG